MRKTLAATTSTKQNKTKFLHLFIETIQKSKHRAKFMHT